MTDRPGGGVTDLPNLSNGHRQGRREGRAAQISGGDRAQSPQPNVRRELTGMFIMLQLAVYKCFISLAIVG